MSNGAVDEFGIPIIPDPPNPSLRKREAIIEAALAVFLREGYSACSVDEIATRAGVSKPTVYKHFGNKERLFLAVIAGVLPSAFSDLTTQHAELANTTDLRRDLVKIFDSWLHILLREDIMALRRLVIGEVSRFPQLGQLWYRVSYDMNNEPLVAACTALHERGLINAPDPTLAVQHLVAVVIGVPQLIRTFQPDTAIDDRAIRKYVESGVDVFLTHYGTS